MNILKPQHETLEIKGKMSYSEGRRAWNLIRLKHDLLKEFPQLKERREKFNYKMIMHRSFEDLKKAIEKMEKEGNLPLVLFFGRE